jgi:ketosteroid isomerase-like protein
MHRIAPLLLLASIAACGSAPPCPVAPPPPNRLGEIATFNAAMEDVTKRMDTAALLALWDDDGVTLLPSTKPIVGKKAVAAFLADVDKQLAGAHVRAFEMHCAGIVVEGDVATEYCDEHQIVDLAGGKPPFEGWGKMLFVLHRGTDGVWRLRREMWNEAVH